MEAIRFLATPTLYLEASRTLAELTGREGAGGVWDWVPGMEWLGKHSEEYPPPPGYVRWKIDVLSLIDPRFEELLWTAEETARINLTEVVWGGVRRDGIPDLQNPPTIAPDEAGYLSPEDRVFGVSINGEHRAYPLRIVNAHEMANDLLGGEPIALAY